MSAVPSDPVRWRLRLLDPNLPARALIEALADKWTAALLILLWREGPVRYNELARRTAIALKVLTAALRRLERDGFVSRTVEPTRPPSVTYALTPLGASLIPVLCAIHDWAEEHFDAVLAARADYDASGERETAP